MQKKKDIKLDFEKIKIERRWLGVDTKSQWEKIQKQNNERTNYFIIKTLKLCLPYEENDQHCVVYLYLQPQNDNSKIFTP